MNTIIPFEFETKPVRVVEMGGEPWFVAKDVCAVLGIKNPSQAMGRLDEDEVTLYKIEGSHRPTNLVSESGLYGLVVRSNKPQAKQFRKWVTSEVLPSIRKTGQYGGHEFLNPVLQTIQQTLVHLDRLERQQAEQDQRLAAVEARQDRMDGDTGYMTVTAFCRAFDVCLPLSDANAFGRRAAQVCRERGLPIGEIPDERFGRVNSYPVPVLQEVAA